jgi:NADH-quinone oxidoreductase subunit J
LEGFLMDAFLFFLFAGIALAGAVNLIRESHPIYSALSLVAVMGALAGLYLMLGAEFIAAVQIIVYAGAIMVLFIFVLMLLNAEQEVRVDRSKMAVNLGPPLLTLLLVEIVAVLRGKFPVSELVHPSLLSGDNTREVGKLLFSKFLLPFEVTSVLILVAIMGAVVLGKRRPDDSR